MCRLLSKVLYPSSGYVTNFRSISNIHCAAGASLRTAQNRCRAGWSRRSAGGARLVDFLCKFGGHLWVPFWELLAVTGRLLGVLRMVPGGSRSSQNLSARPAIRPSVRPAASFFFLEPILEQENGILVEETRKKMSKKVILR